MLVDIHDVCFIGRHFLTNLYLPEYARRFHWGPHMASLPNSLVPKDTHNENGKQATPTMHLSFPWFSPTPLLAIRAPVVPASEVIT